MDVPADIVQVDEDELRGRDVREPPDGVVNSVLILERVGVEVVGLGGTRGGVEVIHKLAKQDSHEWEWYAGPDREYRASDDQE